MSESNSTTFRPGPGFLITAIAAVTVLLLAISAAIASALGAAGVSSVLGGIALIIVGAGLIAALRVPARSLVINAPRLRLARVRSRMATRNAQAPATAAQTAPTHFATAQPTQPAPTRSSSALSHQTPQAGSALGAPAAGSPRELTTADVTSGALSTVLANTSAGHWADEQLAGTTGGETLVRVGQLLAAAFGFLLLALGLASILGQVL